MGRLRASIRIVDGKPRISHAKVADHEWTQNATRPRPERAPSVDTSPLSRATLAEAQRGLAIERTKKLAVERDVIEGNLIPRALVTKENCEIHRIVRESVLNLPARVGAELHAEKDLAKFLIKLDRVLREALHAAADRLVEDPH